MTLDLHLTARSVGVASTQFRRLECEVWSRNSHTICCKVPHVRHERLQLFSGSRNDITYEKCYI